jgi:primosomal protein N' (replication factor Y) (superfamily II helicase)
MERETFFADIILPLALPRVLTYRVPKVLSEYVAIGQRVVVPIGKHKRYTGIIQNIHTTVPSGYEARYVEEILDEQPLIHPVQIELWKWISSYYCCTLGEVMNAALPGGLKLSSETKFVLIENVTDAFELTEKEHLIIEGLKNNGALTLDEINALLDTKNSRKIIKSLLDKRILGAEDEIKERFKPRTADFISLSEHYVQENNLKQLFSELEKNTHGVLTNE